MFFKILSTSLINVNEIRKNKSKEQKKKQNTPPSPTFTITKSTKVPTA